MLAMQLRPDAFTPEQMARNFAYYEAITVRDSSLSACTQAVVAARTGHLDLAFDYLAEAALVDLNDLAGNTDHGVHIASMAGTWTAVVAGFGGMRVRRRRGCAFAPQLPAGADADLVRAGLAGPAAAGVDHARTRRSTGWSAAPPMRLRHHGEPLALADAPVVRPIPEPPLSTPSSSPTAAPRRPATPGG